MLCNPNAQYGPHKSNKYHITKYMQTYIHKHVHQSNGQQETKRRTFPLGELAFEQLGKKLQEPTRKPKVR
jgi:hypothetical protein